jgi:NTP pyrophosphatase (non-canonical NTP hydrolase)
MPLNQDESELMVKNVTYLQRSKSDVPSGGMTLAQYQDAVLRTAPQLSKGEAINHGLFGLMSEVGEMAALFQKVYQGHELSLDRMVEEMGDALWFLTYLAARSGVNLENVAQANLNKLSKRYPEGKFDPERSRKHPRVAPMPGYKSDSLPF